MNDKADTNTVSPLGQANVQATGRYVFEWIGEDGEVLEKAADVNNVFTGNYNKLVTDYNKYAGTPEITDYTGDEKISPVALAVYDDATPAHGGVTAESWGTFRGWIDLCRNFSDGSHATQGNRTTGFWNRQRIDNDTTQYVWVGEFGTSTANGKINKVRLLGTTRHRANLAGDKDSTVYLLRYGAHCEWSGGRASGSSTRSQAIGRVWQHPTYLNSEWRTDTGSDSKAIIAYNLSACNGNWEARALCASLDTATPQIVMQPCTVGTFDSYVPNNTSVETTSTDAFVVTLPTLTSDINATKSGLALNATNDLFYIWHDNTNLNVIKYDASNNWAGTTYQFPSTNRVSSYTSCADIQGSTLRLTLAAGSARSVQMYEVNIDTMALTADGKTINWAAVEDNYVFRNPSSSAACRLHSCVYDTETQGYMVTGKYFSLNSEYPEYLFTVSSFWIKDTPTLTDRQDLKYLGTRAIKSSGDTDTPTSVLSQIYSPSSATKGMTTGAPYIYSTIPSASDAGDALEVHRWYACPDRQCWYGITSSGQAIGAWPMQILPSMVISEAQVPEIDKTVANSLRVTYILTITQNK